MIYPTNALSFTQSRKVARAVVELSQKLKVAHNNTFLIVNIYRSEPTIILVDNYLHQPEQFQMKAKPSTKLTLNIVLDTQMGRMLNQAQIGKE
nr:hypothetical protein [Tanacetum cinerariifolium]